jgi:hypothetical protein
MMINGGVGGGTEGRACLHEARLLHLVQLLLAGLGLRGRQWLAVWELSHSALRSVTAASGGTWPGKKIYQKDAYNTGEQRVFGPLCNLGTFGACTLGALYCII